MGVVPIGVVEAADAQSLRGKRILIIVENLPVPFDRRVWLEARTLKAAGADVCVICPAGAGFDARYEKIEGIHIYRHPLSMETRGAFGFLLEYSLALFHETRLAWKIFFKHGFDIIHACNPPDLIFLVALPFKVLGKHFLFDHHDLTPELYGAKFERRDFFWFLTRVFEWLTFKSADVVISTNQSYRAIALGRGGKAESDVFVVRSGPDLSRVRAVPADPEIKNGRDYLIGYVGVMGEAEGIDLLLEAARILVYDRGRRDIQFTLVGGGPELLSLKALSRDMGLENYVRFTGRAPDEMLFKVLSTADVCVNPDRVTPMNDKSTMNKILEYMALSKPIVQFDVTEGRISAGESSLYAKANDPRDFADKIALLLSDPNRRAHMGELGRRRVEEDLNWGQSIAPLLAAYKRLG